MNNTIEIAKDYETLKKMIKTFNHNFITLKHFTITIALTILFSVSFMFFYDTINPSTLDKILTGVTVTFAIFSSATFVAFSIIAIGQNLSNDKICVTTYPNYYRKYFTDEEKDLLEKMLDDSFENIIQQDRIDIIAKLGNIEYSIEENIFTMEYLESFKKYIEENLEERKQYIPTLKLFAEIYHARDRDNAMLESTNQQLSKIGLSTFRTKAKPTFEIVEEMS